MQEDKIRAALVELLYRNSYGVVVANILISLAAAYVLVGCPTACRWNRQRRPPRIHPKSAVA
jgi:hypothetical protein